MKKILITAKMINIGEEGTTLIALLNNLDKTKYNVDLMLMDAGLLINEVPDYVNIIYYQDYLLTPNKFLYNFESKVMVDSLYDSYRFALRNKYDVAIAFDGMNNYVDMLAASIKADKKIIWLRDDIKEIIDNSNNKPYKKFIYKKMSKKYKYFDTIICSSHSLMDNFNLLLPEYKDKTIYIHDLIDGDKIIEQSKKESSLLVGKGYNLVAVGNMDKASNYDLLLNVQKDLLDKGKNIKLYIIGDGKEMTKIANKVLKLNLIESVILLGNITNPYNIIKKCDLLVNMSSYNKFNSMLLTSNILNIPFVSNINSGTKDLKDIILLNGGILCDNDHIEENIQKIIKGWHNHIGFDYKEYNKDIMKKINELLD